MPVTTQQTLRMVFKNESGGNFTISLDNPVNTITVANIEAVMDLIINRNVFASTGGALVAKADAKIIDRTVNDLYDPA